MCKANSTQETAFLVHATDEEARVFYPRYGMEASPTNAIDGEGHVEPGNSGALISATKPQLETGPFRNDFNSHLF